MGKLSLHFAELYSFSLKKRNILTYFLYGKAFHNISVLAKDLFRITSTDVCKISQNVYFQGISERKYTLTANDNVKHGLVLAIPPIVKANLFTKLDIK